MKFFDQLGTSLVMKESPKRIVCLVPSITEFLVAIGLENSIVGITKFCIHPSHLKNAKEIIGGTKQLQLEKIKQLSPDLIIANKEENTKEDILYLANHFPVWTSEVTNFQSAIDMMKVLSKILNCVTACNQLIDKIQQEFDIFNTTEFLKKGSVLYLIWKNPYMTIGYDTYIHSMLKIAGFESVTEHLTRYPILGEIKTPDYIFLSSEPYPFKEKDIKELQEIFPTSKIQLVDGELFSWYGARMQMFPSYIKELKLN